MLVDAMRFRRLPGGRFGASVLVAAGLVLGACGGDSSGTQELVGYTLEPAPQVGDLGLPDTTRDGETLALRAEPDGLLLVFFGFTNCPDVCPLTMANIERTLTDIGDGDESVDVAMVTVDPTRDTPEILTDYVRSFVPDGHGLRTTDDAELLTVAQRFGASYVLTPTDDGGVDVVHTGSVFVVDDAGEVVLVWTFGTSATDMTADLSELIDRA